MPDTRSRTGILIAVESPLIEAGVTAILERERDLQVLSSCRSGDRVEPLVQQYFPDVAILSVELPRLDGISVAAQLSRSFPDCGVVVMGSAANAGILLRTAEANADAYITTNASPATVLQAVRSAAQKMQLIDPLIGLDAWRGYNNPLKTKEREVLRLTAEGFDTAEVAAMMYLSEGTVRNLLTKILGRLEAKNRTQAVLIAVRAGWI